MYKLKLALQSTAFKMYDDNITNANFYETLFNLLNDEDKLLLTNVKKSKFELLLKDGYIYSYEHKIIGFANLVKNKRNFWLNEEGLLYLDMLMTILNHAGVFGK